ncbi:MAG: glycerol-3-phosphate acyltransferase [Candidatus Riflebacteria bacterium]|nr:glycerol-3-phosphate acyltransferase [Candidatus Riflebacteria bacterium]
MTTIIQYFLACFLIGSLPFGEILARLKTGKSLILPGSRDTRPPGEVFEILGLPLGIFVCLLDCLKGFVAVYPLTVSLIGEDAYSQWWIVGLGGILTVIGHCNSPFLGFKGGRGLAPTFGVMVTLLPVPALLSMFLGLFLAFWGLSSKPGALSAAGAMPLLSIAWVFLVKFQDLDYLYIVAFMSSWTMWEHRSELKNYLGIKSQPTPLPGQTVIPAEGIAAGEKANENIDSLNSR